MKDFDISKFPEALCRVIGDPKYVSVYFDLTKYRPDVTEECLRVAIRLFMEDSEPLFSVIKRTDTEAVFRAHKKVLVAHFDEQDKKK